MPTPSIAREINREAVVLLGWGRAILMQLAHPLVAAAVADHSDFRGGQTAYLRRAHRTIGAMLALTYGTDDEARKAAGRINAIHGEVSGTLGETAGVYSSCTTYSASDPALLAWVHATLVESIPLAYERFVRPLSQAEKDWYCAETADSAPLFGIPDDRPPRSVRELDRYMKTMIASGEVCVTARARSLAHGLLYPPLMWPARRLFGVARLATIGMVPPDIRRAYGFEWDARRERRFQRTAAIIRRVRPFVPPVLREWPEARRRIPH
ncbi:MAG TPA: oxygenase MpaB family protein [Vicinamibacterales bacterium]|jgi:uncharacterized protein (DUF2236 family)|nr:oxygenase MpaB family protein [Vicinamibacterales bacterium]